MKRKSKKPRSLTGDQILRQLRHHEDVLKECKVKRIGLFGSYVSGGHGRHSDIDLLVEFREPSFDHFMSLVDYLEKLLGKKIDLITSAGLSPRVKPYIEKRVIWHEVG